MSKEIYVIIIIALIFGIISSIYRLVNQAYNSNPFLPYPVISHTIDVSRKRNVVYDDYIIQWIMDNVEYDFKVERDNQIRAWRNHCISILNKTILFKDRKIEFFKQMEKEIEDYNYLMFEWRFVRYKTRYRQINYEKYPYIVEELEYVSEKSLKQVYLFDVECDAKIEQFDKNYEDKSTNILSRKRSVTLSQRQRILRRDNFTCQLCGARGPAAGGSARLEVDHKLPFSKGGSDDDSNLWTLCYECNRGKGNKYID